MLQLKVPSLHTHTKQLLSEFSFCALWRWHTSNVSHIWKNKPGGALWIMRDAGVRAVGRLGYLYSQLWASRAGRAPGKGFCSSCWSGSLPTQLLWVFPFSCTQVWAQVLRCAQWLSPAHLGEVAASVCLSMESLVCSPTQRALGHLPISQVMIWLHC